MDKIHPVDPNMPYLAMPFVTPAFEHDSVKMLYSQSETEPLEIDKPEYIEPRYFHQN